MVRYIETTKLFDKQFKKLQSHTKKKCIMRFKLFCGDSKNSALKNHKLHGVWAGYRSINITGDIRALYTGDRNSVVFVAIGTRGELYKK